MKMNQELLNRKDIYVYEFDGKPYFNLTNRCPNACSFCIRQNAEGIKGNRLWLEREPTAAEALAGLKLLEDGGLCYDEAVFCGYGEPTSALIVLLEVAQNLWARGKKLRLNTNGLGNLINGRNIVPELKTYIERVSVSLNAGSAETYEKLCNPSFGQMAYSEIWHFARECATAGINVTMTAVDVIPSDELAWCKLSAEKAGIRFRVRPFITDNQNYT